MDWNWKCEPVNDDFGNSADGLSFTNIEFNIL